MKNLFFVFIFFNSGFGFGQTGAKIEFKNHENTIDFGTINKESDNGIRTIEFINSGDSDLIISSINSGYGCVVYNKSGIVSAGKSGILEVKCNLNVGTLRKTIVLETNAKNIENGVIKLALKGEVLGN